MQAAENNGGRLSISWRWSDNQHMRAAQRACKKGRLKRVRGGRLGATHFTLVEESE